MENSRRFEKHQDRRQQDGLTGLFNQTYFLHRGLEIEVARCRRYKTQLSLIMLDLDNFRSSMTTGHPIGDKVLSTVAYILGEALRKPDILCRYAARSSDPSCPDRPGRSVKLAERLGGASRSYMFSSIRMSLCI